MMTRDQFRKMWVEALRSGAYQKGTSRLQTIDAIGPSFCCLGVAADLWIQHADEIPIDSSTPYWDNELDELIWDGTSYPEFLPSVFNDWLGLLGESGDLADVITQNNVTYESLVQCNDGTDGTAWTFNEIADLIEHKPNLVFGVEEEQG